MAKKKELDNLSLDMIRCKADGFGCDYGRWKAMQERPVVIKPKKDELPEGWRICERCGKAYKPKSKRPQKYCDAVCQRKAVEERNIDKKRECAKAYEQRKRAERKLKNESYA